MTSARLAREMFPLREALKDHGFEVKGVIAWRPIDQVMSYKVGLGWVSSVMQKGFVQPNPSVGVRWEQLETVLAGVDPLLAQNPPMATRSLLLGELVGWRKDALSWFLPDELTLTKILDAVEGPGMEWARRTADPHVILEALRADRGSPLANPAQLVIAEYLVNGLDAALECSAIEEARWGASRFPDIVEQSVGPLRRLRELWTQE